jgi:hypothetical protein
MPACSWTTRSACATAFLALVVMALPAGCSSPTPTAPTAQGNADVAGVWVERTSNYTWTLTQSGTAVTGTGAGVGPFGQAITGTLTGSVTGARFTFSEERSSSVEGVTKVEVVHADDMQVTSRSMTGVVSFLPLYPPYRPVSGTVTMGRVGDGR